MKLKGCMIGLVFALLLGVSAKADGDKGELLYEVGRIQKEYYTALQEKQYAYILGNTAEIMEAQKDRAVKILVLTEGLDEEDALEEVIPILEKMSALYSEAVEKDHQVSEEEAKTYVQEEVLPSLQKENADWESLTKGFGSVEGFLEVLVLDCQKILPIVKLKEEMEQEYEGEKKQSFEEYFEDFTEELVETEQFSKVIK